MTTFYKTKNSAPKSTFVLRCALYFFFLLGYQDSVLAKGQEINSCTVHADFSVSVSNKTATFTNLSTGANKYVWEFGDGQISYSTNPVHVYAKSQRYLVILHAYDTTIGGCEDTMTIWNMLISGCNVTAQFRYAISGSQVSFENNSVNLWGTASLYDWNFGDGYTSTDKDPVHTYSGSGPYNVRCVIEDTNFVGCTDTLFHAFSLDDCDVNVDFTYTFIGPTTIKVTNTSQRANYLSLPFDSLGEYIYSFPYPGSFHFSLVGRNTWCSQIEDTATKMIVVPGCHANALFVIDRDTNSSFAGIIYDYSTFRAGASYMWHFGDGDSSSAHAPNHVYSGPGIYNLCLTIKDSICISTFCDTIEFDSSGNMVGLTTPFSIQVVDAILSVKESSLKKGQPSVYPNPGNDIFTVKHTLAAIQEVKVFDLQGKLITSEKKDGYEVKIDLSTVGKGIYVFAVTDTEGVTSFVKVMKL
jgi:PKD repeat protein